MSQPNNKQPIDDSILDAMLRDVQVPTGLSDQLRAIPDQDQTDAGDVAHKQAPHVVAPSRSNSQGNFSRLGTLLVMAATLIGVAAFLTWAIFDVGILATGPVANHNNSPPSNDSVAVSPALPSTTAPSLEFAELASQRELTEALAQQDEINRLQSRLAALNQTQRVPKGFSTREYHSMINALADQTVIQLGGSEETVATEMVKVIERYPATRGAVIAQEFLDSHPQ